MKPPANIPLTLFDAAAGDVEVLGLEAAYVIGPMSVQAEYIDTQVDLTTGALGYEWDGFYGQLSYILTGESRSYKWKSGTFDRVKPKSGGIGAVELVLRYEDVTITDGDEGTAIGSDVDADRTVLGLNWYVNKVTKFMFNYSSVDLDNEVFSNSQKDKDSLQIRAQYAF